MEYPEYLEMETASEATTSADPETATAVSPAETVIVGDFGHGYVTEDLLRDRLTAAARVILYAGHLEASDFGMLGGVKEATVVCPAGSTGAGAGEVTLTVGDEAGTVSLIGNPRARSVPVSALPSGGSASLICSPLWCA